MKENIRKLLLLMLVMVTVLGVVALITPVIGDSGSTSPDVIEPQWQNTETVSNAAALQSVINSAKTSGEPTIITLTGDITLSGTQINIPAGAAVKLTGNTEDSHKLDANNNSRVIQVNSDAELWLENIVISGGNISSSSNTFGGGIYNAGTVVITGVSSISGNKAVGADARGGGVYSTGIFIMEEGTSINNNTSTAITTNYTTYANGVYNTGIFVMNGGEISGNSTNVTSNNGGGVYNTGSFIMNRGTIGGITADKANSARFGGGVYNEGASAEFHMYSGAKILNNGYMEISEYVQSNTYSGGGIYNNGGTLIMEEGSVISGNRASGGSGGVGNFGQSAKFFMNGGEITDNSIGHGSDGGGVYNSQGTFIMEDGLIARNKRNSSYPQATYGIAVYNTRGTFHMKGGEISDNGIRMYEYGAVCNAGGTFIMEESSVICNNKTIGVYNTSAYASSIKGDFTMKGGEIYDNEERGVSNNSGDFIMYDGKIYNNNGGVSNSGTNYIGASSNFTMEGGEIYANVTSDNNGGGGVYSSGVFVMNDGKIYNNKYIANTEPYSNISGGGGINNSNKFTMNGGKIYGNYSDTHGGGVYNWNYGTSFIMNDGEIYNNESVYGGGISVGNNYGPGYWFNSDAKFASFTMDGGSIYGNEAEYGGGIYLMNGGFYQREYEYTQIDPFMGNSHDTGDYKFTFDPVIISKGEIYDNTAVYGGGIYLDFDEIYEDETEYEDEWGEGEYYQYYYNYSYTCYQYYGLLDITGGKIYNNVASYSGGGIFVKGYDMDDDIEDGTSISSSLWNLSVGSDVTFSDNEASYRTGNIMSQHVNIYSANILSTQWTTPFTQGYNNYDIGYGATYTITFMMNDGSGDIYSSKSVTSPDMTLGAEMPENPVRSGYSFNGWNTNENGNGTAFTSNTEITGDIRVYAIWEPDTLPVYYTVIYDPGTQGTWTASSQTTSGLSKGVPTPEFTGNTDTDHNPNWKFSGWAPAPGATVTGDALYVAQWIYTPPSEPDNDKKVTIRLKKELTDINGEITGNGKKFAVWLYDEDMNPLGRYILSANEGEVAISGLSSGKTYYIAEETGAGFDLLGYTVEKYGSTDSHAIGLKVMRLEISQSVDILVNIINRTENTENIPDGEPPLLPFTPPEKPPVIEIPDEDSPLGPGLIPKTGDNAIQSHVYYIIMAVVFISMCVIIYVKINMKKQQNKES